ncbi:Uncharacterised protein [Klebsiella pneumoniae]|nr:Uncharacterised protein [Klebsiella pneumoniae]
MQIKEFVMGFSHQVFHFLLIHFDLLSKRIVIIRLNSSHV